MAIGPNGWQRNPPKELQKCEGSKCPARDDCARYVAPWHPQQPSAADYSQRPDFKPPCARESCQFFLIIPNENFS